MPTSPPPGPAQAQATCDDCFFRCELLCALPGTAICPTFRAVERAPVLRAISEPLPKPLAAAAA